MGPAGTSGVGVGLEPPHRPQAPFHWPVILFEMVVEVLGSTMLEVVTKHLLQGRRVAGVLSVVTLSGVVPVTVTAERKSASAAS
jgi:hypothetical protein